MSSEQPPYDSPFDALVGTKLLEASGDRVVATVPVDADRHMQPLGLVHGGVFTTVVETVASIGATLWLGDEGTVVGLSNHTDFLRPVGGGALRFEATPLHRGRSTQLWQVTVLDGDRRRVAHGKVRLFNRRE